MPYFLKHSFDPDFNHLKMKPREMQDGRLDIHNMNYVQNVLKGDLLAQWEDVSETCTAELDQRFIYPKKVFPQGPRTRVDPANPDRLLADADGYVFYENGLIRVKKMLNVRQNVDMRTGNISFVNNMVVHGSVQAGFRVQARNVMVREHIEAAEVVALETIVCMGGAKGGEGAFLDAGKSIQVGFCENATLNGHDDVMVRGTCMHSQVYAGRRFHVRGRLIGGFSCCYDYAYVAGDVGNRQGAETQILVGYDPMLLYRDFQLNARIKRQIERIRQLEAGRTLTKGGAEEVETQLVEARERLAKFEMGKAKVWERIQTSEKLDDCRVMVMGTVHPGTEISIGTAYLALQDPLSDVRFFYEDGEVKWASPAKA